MDSSDKSMACGACCAFCVPIFWLSLYVENPASLYASVIISVCILVVGSFGCLLGLHAFLTDEKKRLRGLVSAGICYWLSFQFGLFCLVFLGPAP